MKRVFFVVGPTAVGKTAATIELAQEFEAEIVNADAFQIYQGLDILTAKADEEMQRRVRHHLLSQVSLAETMSAAKFRELARAALADIHSRQKNAIIVGGSGLYVKAITHGFDPVPPPDPTLREELSALPQTELARRLQTLVGRRGERDEPDRRPCGGTRGDSSEPHGIPRLSPGSD